jgi:hypothetical protein
VYKRFLFPELRSLYHSEPVPKSETKEEISKVQQRKKYLEMSLSDSCSGLAFGR